MMMMESQRRNEQKMGARTRCLKDVITVSTNTFVLFYVLPL